MVPPSILKKLRRLLTGLGLLFLLGMAWLTAEGLRDRVGPAEVALVLGSKVELNGQPSVRLKARLNRTIELYQQGCFPWVISSGGVGKEGFDEAAVMRDYLVTGGIPADRIILDSQGNTTYLSAANTAAIMKERGMNSVLVVSQYFHIPRSRLALQKFGVKKVQAGHPSFFEWRDFYSVAREVVGYVRYSFRGYTQ